MKIGIFIFLLSVLASCLPKQKGAEKSSFLKPIKVTGITEIKFNEEIHDFGMLKSGEIVVASFTFSNTGEHNLVIDEIESGCGCIKVDFPKEPVKVNGKGVVEVEFDSSGMFGKQYKTIEIHANFKEPKQLAIFAVVKNEELEIKY